MEKPQQYEKAIKRNLKIKSLHLIRANNDNVLGKCPALASILIKTQGWNFEVAKRFRTEQYTKSTIKGLYNIIRK